MADVLVAGTVFAGYPATASGRALAFVDENTGYIVYSDGTNLVYAKTTNGGSSWGSPVTLASVSVTAGIDIWADWWTPGDTGTKLHIIYTDGTNSDLKYVNLDTASDTIGTIRTLTATGTWISGCMVTVAKSVNGQLLAAGRDGTPGSVTNCFRSTDEFATVNSCASPIESFTTDYFLFFPGDAADTKDMRSLYWDISANQVSVKFFDDSANSWSESTTITATEPSAANTFPPFSGAIRHSDGALIFAFFNDYDTATADLKCYSQDGTGNPSALTDVFSNIDDAACPAVFIDQNNNDIYVGYLGKSDGTETFTATVKVYYKKSTDDGSTWGSEVAYSEDAADDFRSLWVDMGGVNSRMGFAWYDDDDDDIFFGYTNSISITEPSGTTATIASLLDELTAALSVNQYDRVTIVSNVDELTASLSVDMPATPNIASVLDELQALLNINQTQQVTIGAALDELTCSITLNMAPAATIASSVDEVTVSLNIDQSTPVSLTIASTLDELQAALSVEQRDDVTIASLLDELTSALSVKQSQQVTIGASVDELNASLSIEQRILMTIAAVIDEATASLNAEQRYLLTIGATLDEATASLTLEQRILLSVASALDELQASVSAQQTQQVTISAMVDEFTASLSLEQRVLMTVVSVIDEAVGSLAVNQTNVLTIAALLDELTASLDVSLLNFIYPEIGKILMALDRDETLFALRGLDATQTLMALARDETLFALQGYDGIETLRALDRDEALNPLEARV